MKKVISAVLATALAIACSVGAYANEPAAVTYYAVDGQTIYSNPDVPISPRFSYLNSVASSIGREGSTITCTGTISIFQDYEVGIVVKLQRSTDGKTWSNVPKAVWVDNATRQGVTPLTGTFTATKGYQYRATTAASVKDSSGRLLETVTAISGVEYYL